MDSHFRGDRAVEWVWFRVEYQKRGAAHIHGCCRLKDDPGLCKLGDKVLLGRKAQKELEAAGIEFGDSPSFSPEQKKDDVWVADFTCSDPLDDEEILLRKQKVADGVEAEKTIVDYHDRLLSTMHPNPPSDAASDARSEETLFQYGPDVCHPSAVEMMNPPPDHFPTLIDTVQRHKCSAYCMRRNKCRGGFAHDLQAATHVAVKQNHRKDKTINSTLELLTKRNDRWMNSCSHEALFCWKANMDMRLTIDVGKIIAYMTKYVTKTETSHPSSRTRHLLFSTLRRYSDDGSDTATILKRLMTAVHGERIRSKQETAHLITGLPLVHCDHIFKKIDLRNRLRAVDVQEEEEEEEEQDASATTGTEPATAQAPAPATTGEVTLKTVIDAYGSRMDPSLWNSDVDYRFAVHDGLKDWSLDRFAVKFCVGQSKGVRNKIKLHAKEDKTIIVFQPRLPSFKHSDCYAEYCRLSLTRYRPFEGTTPELTDEEAVEEWEAFLQNIEEPPDHLRRQIDRLLQYRDNDNDDDDGEGGGGRLDFFGAGEEGDDAEMLELEYSDIANAGLAALFDDDDDEIIQWDEDHDFTLPSVDLSSCSFEDPAARLQELAENGGQGLERVAEEVDSDDLNLKQTLFVEAIEILLDYDETYSSTDGGPGLSRCGILRGRGGTGKSHAINYLRGVIDDIMAVLATTGKAASVVFGSTVFNRRSGLALPVGREQYRPLQGKNLKLAQERWAGKRVLIVDEYSMLHQKHLSFMNERLKEIMGNNRLFGGLIVVLVGDTAQLPPVQGPPLWCRKRSGKSTDNLKGMKLYFDEFKFLR